jgi:hypothetical protein
MYKLCFSFRFCEVIEDIIFCVRRIHYEFFKIHYDFFKLCFVRYCISSVYLLLIFLRYQNSGKKIRYIFSNITFDVLYHLTKIDIKAHLYIKKQK